MKKFEWEDFTFILSWKHKLISSLCTWNAFFLWILQVTPVELDLKHQRMGKKKKKRRREIRVGDAENHFYPQCKLHMEEKKW